MVRPMRPPPTQPRETAVELDDGRLMVAKAELARPSASGMQHHHFIDWHQYH